MVVECGIWPGTSISESGDFYWWLPGLMLGSVVGWWRGDRAMLSVWFIHTVELKSKNKVIF